MPGADHRRQRRRPERRRDLFPPLLVLIILLGADPQIMKQRASGRLSLALTGIAAVTMGLAAIALFISLIHGG